MAGRLVTTLHPLIGAAHDRRPEPQVGAEALQRATPRELRGGEPGPDRRLPQVVDQRPAGPLAETRLYADRRRPLIGERWPVGGLEAAAAVDGLDAPRRSR